MEAAVEDGPTVHELSAQCICARIVQSHSLQPENQQLSKTQITAQAVKCEIFEYLSVLCPMRRQEGDRCGWRSEGSRSHRWVDWRAHGRSPAEGGQLS